jgi:hypothetical protein
MKKVLFKEEQQFRQWWMTLIVMASSIPAAISLVYSFFKLSRNSPFDRSTMPLAVSIVVLIVVIVVLWVYFSTKLEVWIDQDGVHYRYFPQIYKNKLISKEEIARYEIRKYSAIWDYGGWGVRRGFGRKWQRAYNVSGNIGLQLYFKNGKKVLFGTQRSQAILFAMDEMMKSK